MKKLTFLAAMIFIVSIGIGFCFGRVLVSNKTATYSKFEGESVNGIPSDNQVAEAVSTELKVKPNMEFALKEYYDECGHFNFEYLELPRELINMTRQEVEDHYNGAYEVEEFTDKTLVLTREINGMCDNHYVVKLNGNNKVDVYKINTDTSYSLYETTDISRDFLPIDDIEKLEEGIVVYGLGKVNSILEDYE